MGLRNLLRTTVATVVDACARNPELRAHVKADPKAALAEEGVDLPFDEARVVEDTPETTHVLTDPNAELSDEQMETVVGGTGMHPMWEAASGGGGGLSAPAQTRGYGIGTPISGVAPDRRGVLAATAAYRVAAVFGDGGVCRDVRARCPHVSVRRSVGMEARHGGAPCPSAFAAVETCCLGRPRTVALPSAGLSLAKTAGIFFCVAPRA